MARPRTAVVSTAITTYCVPSAIPTTPNMKKCWNGWATILIQKPFPSITSIEGLPRPSDARQRSETTQDHRKHTL